MTSVVVPPQLRPPTPILTNSHQHTLHICTICGATTDLPLYFVKSNQTYLTQCPTCNNPLDKAIQYNLVIVLISVLLHRYDTYIHLAAHRISDYCCTTTEGSRDKVLWGPVLGLITFLFGWIVLTTFCLSLGLSGLTLHDVIEFSQAPLDILSRTTTNLQINDLTLNNFAPQNFLSILSLMWSYITAFAPFTFKSVPSYFKLLLVLDIQCLLLMIVMIPFLLSTYYEYYNEKIGKKLEFAQCLPKASETGEKKQYKPYQSPNTISLLQSSLLYAQFILPALFSRVIFLIYAAFSISHVNVFYIIFTIALPIIHLTMATVLYYHIVTKNGIFYGFDNTTATRPNLQELDLFSIRNNFTPVLIVFGCYIAPIYGIMSILYPKIHFIALYQMVSKFFLK